MRTILRKNKISFPKDASKKKLVSIFWDAAPNSSSETQPNEENSSEALEKKTRKRERRKKSKANKASEAGEDLAEKVVQKTSESSEPSVSEKIQSEVLTPPEVRSSNVKISSNATEHVQDPATPAKKHKITSKDLESKEALTLTLTLLQKRRSMALEAGIPHSDSPSKGNIFEVDSDSDENFLSPKRKKFKAQLLSASNPELKPSLKSPKVKSKVDSCLTDNGTEDITVKPASEKLSSQLLNKVDESIVGNNDATADGSDNVLDSNSQSEISGQKVEAKIPSIDNSTSSIEEELKEYHEANNEKGTSINDKNNSPSESSFDTAPSFDKALQKLKKSKNPTYGSLHSKIQTDEELARYLGVNIHSVKPVKSTRNITPRRPICINKSDLVVQETTKENASKVSQDILDFDEDDNNALNISNAPSEQVDVSDTSNSDDELEATPRGRHFIFAAKNLFYFLLWLTVVGGLLYGYWFREQTILIGYCGQEINQTTIPHSENYPAFLFKAGEYLDDNFKPSCVDCPQHARCFPKLKIACYDDFVPSRPWFFNYLPFIDPKAQRCVPDTKKAEKIESMIDISLDLLRARNANKLCGRSPADDFEAGLSFGDLHNLLISLKAPYITEEEFEELWSRAAVELEKEPEIIVRQVNFFESSIHTELYTNNQTGFKFSEYQPTNDTPDSITEKIDENKILRSTALSHLSFKCLMSNTLVSLLVKFKTAVIILSVVISVTVVVYWKYQESQVYAQKIDTIYKEVLNKLQRQANLSLESTELPAYIGAIQLRDLILSEENNLAYKMRLWEGISRKVDRNTNVSRQLLEVHGEVMKVWQWIGSLE